LAAPGAHSEARSGDVSGPGPRQPSKGLHIYRSLHLTTQTRTLVVTLHVDGMSLAELAREASTLDGG